MSNATKIQIKKLTLSILATAFITGCATPITDPERLPIKENEKREFIYEFSIPNKSQKEILKNARNFIASSYVNSNEISRVEDMDDGIIMAKAEIGWKISTNNSLLPYLSCRSRYEINFVAKNEKARLRLFLIEGALPPCTGWHLPEKKAYRDIVSEFNSIAKSMDEALKGNSAINKLKDF
ncbi:DUF4468 domain-containing protein [Laribacter hongkongensis]|uniref:DUF4468 domain-containing protein n=1 Tax=Laribacter hongkongensis TaxID=168471 RepID=UPI001EFD0D21|nr:DUF4468 domain-containing protein [Laribacter hongkongensis]MCG9124747.1 DUF4468 domain-containing protein [Laribacter hongkongensis]